MLEQYLIEKMAMNGEIVRIAVAVVGTAIASWYDLRNNRNVPDNFLYAFLAVACISNLIYFQQDVFTYAISVGFLVFILGYLFYRMGYIGGADIYVLTSIALLVPVFPSYINAQFNLPVVMSVVITSGILFSLYFLYFIAANIIRAGKKGRFEYLLLVPAYAVLVYFLNSIGVFGPLYLVSVSVLILSSIVFLVYKEQVVEAMSRKIPLSEVEAEDVAVLELMPALAKKYNIQRLLNSREIARLRKLKMKEKIYVYTDLPPFLPFVLAALIVSVVFGDLLMHSISL